MWHLKGFNLKESRFVSSHKVCSNKGTKSVFGHYNSVILSYHTPSIPDDVAKHWLNYSIVCIRK